MVKNLPAMWETQVRSLGWEDTLEKEMATHYTLHCRGSDWSQAGDLECQVLRGPGE